MVNNKISLQNKPKKVFKFYEDPLDFGVFSRFDEAIKALSTENGSLNKRLYHAYYDCGIVHLWSDNFEDEFIRVYLKEVEKMISDEVKSIKDMKLSSDYCRVHRQFDFHWKKASRMANCIFIIYRYLVKLRMTRE